MWDYYACDTKYHKRCSTMKSTHLEFVVEKREWKLYYSFWQQSLVIIRQSCRYCRFGFHTCTLVRILHLETLYSPHCILMSTISFFKLKLQHNIDIKNRSVVPTTWYFDLLHAKSRGSLNLHIMVRKHHQPWPWFWSHAKSRHRKASTFHSSHFTCVTMLDSHSNTMSTYAL